MAGEQPGWAALTGQTQEEYQGFGWARAVHPDDAQPTIDAWNETVRQRKAFIFEHRVRRHDGVWRRCSIHAIPVLREDGSIHEWVGVHTDITEQRKAEAALAESEARLKLATEGAGVGTWEVDFVSDHAFGSPEALALLGVQHSTFSAESWLETIHPDDRPQVAACWQRALADGVPYDTEYRSAAVSNDGERWLAARGRIERDAEGRPIRAAGIMVDVTARKQAEAALAESSERLRLALEAGQMGIWSWDLATDRLEWDARQFELFGIDPAGGQPTGAQVLARVHPEDLPGLQDSIQTALEAGNGVFSHEFRMPVSDGSVRWVAGHGHGVSGADGQAVRMVGLNFDVTERREAEAALARNEAQLRTIVETVPLGLVMAELPSGRIVGGNSYVETLLRHLVLYSPDIHSYDEWVSFHTDGTRVDGHEYPLARMVAGEENPSIDVLYQRGDGTRAWTRIMGRPVRNERGELVGGVVALVDIDGERQAREALAESEARLALALKGAQIGVHEIDFVLDTYRVDAAVARMFESSAPPGVWRPLDDDLRRECLSRVHPEDASLRQACLERLKCGNDTEAELDFRMSRRDGNQVWLHQQFIITERNPATGAGRRLLGLTRDVTQSRDMQAVLERLVEERTHELRETQTRLAHTERMQALGQLAGGIAHDFNNVLQAVQGGSALLGRRCGKPDEIRRLADLILKAAERGAGVTNRLLAFSR
jgi:PAS domain S-box-containing protein